MVTRITRINCISARVKSTGVCPRAARGLAPIHRRVFRSIPPAPPPPPVAIQRGRNGSTRRRMYGRPPYEMEFTQLLITPARKTEISRTRPTAAERVLASSVSVLVESAYKCFSLLGHGSDAQLETSPSLCIASPVAIYNALSQRFLSLSFSFSR